MAYNRKCGNRSVPCGLNDSPAGMLFCDSFKKAGEPSHDAGTGAAAVTDDARDDAERRRRTEKHGGGSGVRVAADSLGSGRPADGRAAAGGAGDCAGGDGAVRRECGLLRGGWRRDDGAAGADAIPGAGASRPGAVAVCPCADGTGIRRAGTGRHDVHRGGIRPRGDVGGTLEAHAGNQRLVDARLAAGWCGGASAPEGIADVHQAAAVRGAGRVCIARTAGGSESVGDVLCVRAAGD